jgi:hypothetical protein
VGALNHKFFVLFVFYTTLSCFMSLFLIIVRSIHCGVVKEEASSEDGSGVSDELANTAGTVVNSETGEENQHLLLRFLAVSYARNECAGWHESYAVIALFIVSLVFLIFTCVMLAEQLEAIETNSSKIARMKMRVGQAGTELSRVTEEFNEMFGGETDKVTWHWYLPLPVQFPRSMKKVVLGYEWDETFDAVPYDDGSESKIEMTSRSSSSSLVGEQQPMQGDVEAGLQPAETGEEGTFSGTPVRTSSAKGNPALTKRSNSIGRLKDENRFT